MNSLIVRVHGVYVGGGGGIFVLFLSFDSFLLRPCTIEQWLAYHNLRSHGLDHYSGQDHIAQISTLFFQQSLTISDVNST
jgi:hypothetical protein